MIIMKFQYSRPFLQTLFLIISKENPVHIFQSKLKRERGLNFLSVDSEQVRVQTVQTYTHIDIGRKLNLNC